MELVERDDVLRLLEERLGAAALGAGGVALVSGEAGIGKSSVLQALAERRGDARLWWGACDALQTPHPLAPLLDIARSMEVPFRALLAAEASRVDLFEAVLAELQRSRAPTLLVIEDAHWADDATLDLVRFLGRRIDRAPCLLALSYRDDELAPTHPLRRLLGELPGSLVSRIELGRLSPAAVEALARGALQSAAGVHAATRGNPFFVTELLRHGVEGVPRSVQDLALSRFARLSPAAQAVVRLASVTPTRIERRLVQALLAPGVAVLEECLGSGLLNAADAALSFRHELMRAAIEGSLAEPVGHALHAQVLAALVAEGDPEVPLARLVHHATRAGERAAVLRYAPEAARQARDRGSRREAAAHWRTALEHAEGASGVAESDVVAWLKSYARECHFTDQLEESIRARLRLNALHRRSGDVSAEAENTSELALAYAQALRTAEADAASRRALALLEAMPPSIQLAGAWRVEAQLRMLGRDFEAAIACAEKAQALAERFGSREIVVAAISTLGAALSFIDFDAGRQRLTDALDMALAERLHYNAANTFNNLGAISGELFRLDDADRYMSEAIAFADRHEIDMFRNYCVSWLALSDFYRGDWNDAAEHARDILEQPVTCSTSRLMALVALGRLRVRRGDPGAAELLDEALELALSSAALQHVAPVRAARAEAAFLRGDFGAAAAEAGPAHALAVRHRHAWFAGELAYWLYRAGAASASPDPCAEPYAHAIAGQWRAAADAWTALGCPYERARALAEGDGPARLEALALFEQLGARPAAEGLRRQLRADGVRGLPRGVRASTQTHPHRLTMREAEVLRLLCEGLRNSEIAERMFRSVRTVDHHLEAVFAKLGVASRAEAIALTLRGGAAQSGQPPAAIRAGSP
jgi:DNA-binding CsgD family transcriptional regulator/tetratricopeptide (TPR) repeat protein